MAKDKTLDLTIKIAGQVDSSLTSAINQTQKSVSSLSQNLSKIGTVGLAAMGALAAGTTAAIVQCTNVAEEVETYMADVVKYVDGLADSQGYVSDEIAENGQTFAENYDEMKTALLDLSTVIPYTMEELTELAAIAGQSGYSMDELISYDENGDIQGFLKDVAEWGVAMDVDAEQAADWAAKWEVAFGMTHDEVMEMADIINYLGANSATTAAEIAQVVNETVSMGEMAGVDAKTTIAIADAMLAMGVSADSAGTSIKRMYTNLTKGYAASSTIQNALAKLGMDAEGVAEAMVTDGTQTILDILQGIKELPESEQLATVSSLFGQWAVEGGGKLAENIELLEWAIEAANDPSLYTGSMAREFIIKSGTTESIDLMLSNAWYALEADVGEAFLPVKQEFSLLLIDIIDGLRDNMPQLEQIAETFATVLSSAVSKLGEAFEKALPYIQSGLDYVANNGEKVAQIIGGLAATFAAMKAAPLVETVVKGAGSLISGISSGTGSIGGLASAGTGLFSSISSTVQAAKIGAGLANSSLTAQAVTSQATEGISGKLTTASNSVLGAIFGIKNKSTLTGDSTDKSFLSGLLSTAGQITDAKDSGGLLTTVKTFISGTGAGKYASGIGSSISGMFNGLLSLGAGDSGSTAGLLSGVKSFGSLISTVMSPVTSMFSGILTTALPIVAVIGSIIAVLSILYDNMDGIREIIGNVFGEAGLEKFDSFASGLANVIDKVQEILNGGLADALSGVREKFVGLFDGDASALAGTTFDNIVMMVQSVLNVFGQLVSFATGTLKPIIQDIFGYITGTVLPIILETFNSSAPIISEIILNIGTAIMTVAQIIGTAIMTALPYIEMIVTAFLNVASVAIPALLSGFNYLWESLTSIVQSIQQVFEGLITFITGVFTGNWEQAWEGVKEIFGGVFDALVELCKVPFNAVIAIINNVISSINGMGFTIPEWVPVIGGQSFTLNIPEIPMLATGGFTSGPSIAGEKGTEAVISFQSGVRSENIDTWARAGQMLGVDSQYYSLDSLSGSSEVELEEVDTGDTSNRSENVTFAPQITIQGNADQSVVDDLMGQMQNMFEKWYQQRQRQQARTAY